MITIFFLVMFGLVFGSFINALVWRMHEQEKQSQVKPTGKKKPSQVKSAKNNKQKAVNDLSILHGRSMCPDCHHTLAAKDLLPVLSWLSLRGRCRYCRKPISWQYPLVEVATAGLFVLTYLTWQDGLGALGWARLGLWLAAVVLYVALAVYDIRWYILPTRLVYILVAVGVAVVCTQWLEVRTFTSLWEPALAASIFYALFRGLYEVSKGRWIGYGDVRLSVALGLLAGTPLRVLMVLFFASTLGSLITLPALIRGKTAMQSQIPFGPYLLAGSLIVQFFGAAILAAYWKIIGF